MVAQLSNKMVLLLLITMVIKCSYAVRYIIDNDGDSTDYIAIPIDVCYKNKIQETNYIKYTCHGTDRVTKTKYSDDTCNTLTGTGSITQTFTAADQSPCVTQPKFDCTGDDSYSFNGVFAAFTASCTSFLLESTIPYANGCYCDTATSSYTAACDVLNPTSANAKITKYLSSTDCSSKATDIQHLSTCTEIYHDPMTNLLISAQTKSCITPAPTTASSTSSPTTVSPTTVSPTTASPTTVPLVRSVSPTKTQLPTTASLTTSPSRIVLPTTISPTTKSPTTTLPTTTLPTTTLPTTTLPTTNIMTSRHKQKGQLTTNIRTLSPFEILSYWIIKDSANCGDGYTDLNKSNNYYGIYCVPCPELSAGTYGQCFECGASEQPNHSRTECIDKGEELFYASNEFNAIISVVSTLTGCGCLCGFVMFIKKKYFTTKDTERQNKTSAYSHVAIETA